MSYVIYNQPQMRKKGIHKKVFMAMNGLNNIIRDTFHPIFDV